MIFLCWLTYETLTMIKKKFGLLNAGERYGSFKTILSKDIRYLLESMEIDTLILSGCSVFKYDRFRKKEENYFTTVFPYLPWECRRSKNYLLILQKFCTLVNRRSNRRNWSDFDDMGRLCWRWFLETKFNWISSTSNSWS